MTLEELAERLKVLYGDRVFIDGEYILVSIFDIKFIIMHPPRETSIYIAVNWHLNPEDITSYQDLCIFCNESNRIFTSKVFSDQYDDKIDFVNIGNWNTSSKEFPVINDEKGKLMIAEIEKAREMGDSVGGVIECAVTGVEAGFGDPMFDGVENQLAKNVFGIPAVKGIEFGNGFSATDLYGSENNDDFCIVNGEIKTATNNAGGINGGITNGMPIVFRTAIKPTPSIYKEQNSVSIANKTEQKLQIQGRHDPCIVQRAVPVVEAVTAFTILDIIL